MTLYVIEYRSLHGLDAGIKDAWATTSATFEKQEDAEKNVREERNRKGDRFEFRVAEYKRVKPE